MEPPGITRHRRPFLAPLWLPVLAALVVAVALFSMWRGATTTVVVLVSAASRSPGTIDDPPLSPEDEQRALRLALMFGAGGRGSLDGIYVSDDRRAQQTAAPLAQALQRAPVVFAAADARSVAARALREHAGGTVLMVLSGATLPQVQHELTGADSTEASAAADTDVLFIESVPSFGHGHVLRVKY